MKNEIRNNRPAAVKRKKKQTEIEYIFNDKRIDWKS